MINAKLLERRKITEDLGIFRFETETSVSFIPGQYNTLSVKTHRIAKPVVRPFSIASTPDNPKNIEYLIRWVRSGGRKVDGGGEMTTELFELCDDELKDSQFRMSDKGKGKFYLDDGDDREVFLVCTGTGLAPFMGQLRADIQRGRDLARYTLVHGVANCEDLAYSDELTRFANEKGLRYLHAESRQGCGGESEVNYVGQWFFNREKGRAGRIKLDEINAAIEEGRLNDSAIERSIGRNLTHDRDAMLLCGNPDMIDNMTRLMEAREFIEGKDVFSERYWAAKKETYKT